MVQLHRLQHPSNIATVANTTISSTVSSSTDRTSLQASDVPILSFFTPELSTFAATRANSFIGAGSAQSATTSLVRSRATASLSLAFFTIAFATAPFGAIAIARGPIPVSAAH